MEDLKVIFEDIKEIEDLSFSISDILCWLCGYMSASPGEYFPLDLRELRLHNIKLKNILKKIKEEN